MRWILIIVAAFILYKLIVNSKNKAAKKQEKKQEAKPEKDAATGVLVKDPVCGTYVSNQSDIRVKDHDAVHCFCSYTCRDKYIRQRRGAQGDPETPGASEEK